MYNLLVSYNENEWNGDPFVIERSRCVCEYTDEEIADRFSDLGPKQLRVLYSLPTVFAYEKSCGKDPKYGFLRSVKRIGNKAKVRIEYQLVPCDRFVTANDLLSLSELLDIGKWELNRTHWAVKDVDLGAELGRRRIELPTPPRMALNNPADIERHKFAVALSFPGEHRDYVERVAEELNQLLGQDTCFYDKYFEAQLAKPDADLLLQEIYGIRSSLVVVFLCKEYNDKEWCGIEWRKIRERRASGGRDDIMYVRIGEGEVSGVSRLDCYVDAQERAPVEIARMIEERVQITRERAMSMEEQRGRGRVRRTIREEIKLGKLSTADLEEAALLARTLEYHERLNVPDDWQVVRTEGDDLVLVTRGGQTGLTPLGDDYDSSWKCFICGSAGPWNGSRCMNCGRFHELD